MSIASTSNILFVFQNGFKMKILCKQVKRLLASYYISNEEHIDLDYYEYEYLKAYCPYFPEPIPTVQCWAGAGVHVSKPIPR